MTLAANAQAASKPHTVNPDTFRLSGVNGLFHRIDAGSPDANGSKGEDARKRNGIILSIRRSEDKEREADPQ